MYSVYKITNLINNKSYIGSSIRVKKRWREHINCSQNINSDKYNYPLYQAFRKYGLENFSFEILKDDFDSALEMQEFEREIILTLKTYDGIHGYNQTTQTENHAIGSENLQKYLEKIKKKCALVDNQENILETYESYHDAARKNGFDGDKKASAIRDVCKGIESCIAGKIFRDLDESGKVISKPLKRYKGKKPLIAIKIDNPDYTLYFESVSDAARKLSADRSSIGKCIAGSKRYTVVKGYIFRELDFNGNIIENDISIEDRIKEYNEKNPMINGERHNIKDWCNIFNISTVSFYKRKAKGMSTIEALTIPKGGDHDEDN